MMILRFITVTRNNVMDNARPIFVTDKVLDGGYFSDADNSGDCTTSPTWLSWAGATSRTASRHFPGGAADGVEKLGR